MNIGARILQVSCLCLLILTFAVMGFAADGDVPQQENSVLSKAFYLSASDAIWVRPGLNVKIIDKQIPADRKPVVTFRVADDGNQGLDREGKLTPASITFRFVLAYIPQNDDRYVDYIVRTAATPSGGTVTQASTDSTGTWTSLGDGNYTYKFNAVLPANYDQTATHTLCIQATRNLTSFEMSTYVVNELVSWVPNGAQVTKIRDVVPTSACNQCHDPISAHGGGRIKMEYCILCHTPQTSDGPTGNTANMSVMTHKIHMGKNLPSVISGMPYYFGASPTTGSNFSNVGFPQDLRNCTTCHQGTKQVDRWKTFVARDTCGSCHDNINFATGKDHVNLPQKDDSHCADCHQPNTGDEYDASIVGAHIAEYKSKQMVNPKMELLTVTNTAPGQKPTVTFRVTDKDGKFIQPSVLAGTTGRLSLTIGGPTSDYRWYVSEAADKATVSGNVATYTFTAAIPATATGTYALEGEAYVNVTLNPGTVKALAYRNAVQNPVKAFAVTGTTVTPRRTSVDLAKCNKCHDKLQLHGNNRNAIEACVVCHNPATTDSGVRPAAKAPAEAIDMQIMIHKIHTGEELDGGYIVYGRGSSVNDFSEVAYPGDRRNCLACHVANAYTVPLPATATSSTTPRGYWDPTRPTAAACLGCHDSVEAAAHALLNTATFGESCAVCHKEIADFAVSKVHAR